MASTVALFDSSFAAAFHSFLSKTGYSTKEHPNSLPIGSLSPQSFIARKIEPRWLEQSSKTKGKVTIKRAQREFTHYAERELLRWNIK